MTRNNQRRYGPRPDEPGGNLTGELAPSIWIYSARGADLANPGTCLIEWDEDRWRAGPDAVRDTAHDLLTAASLADLLTSLFRRGIDGNTAREIVTSMMSRNLGHPDIFPMIAAGGAEKQKLGMVLIEHDDRRTALTSETAREMAANWIQVAEASNTDSLFDEAMKDVLHAHDTERAQVFAYLRTIRQDPKARTEALLEAEKARIALLAQQAAGH